MNDTEFLAFVKERWPANVKVGKTGRVRLTGEALSSLRGHTYMESLERCQNCAERIFYAARFAGDPLAYDMAHIKSRGAGGSDLPSNVRALCHRDHMAEHSGRRIS